MQENHSDSKKTTPSRNEVWKMFDRIAHRYDLLNRLLSLGRDVAWRKSVSKYLPQRSNLSVLDLATGTADLLISVHDHSGRLSSGVGIDMAAKMLDIARAKIAERNLQSTLSVVHGDATRLPFDSGSFDAVTIAFGIRNFTDVPAGLKEMYRILSSDSKALILEFSLPGNWFVRQMYLIYFRYVLPLVGSVISGDSYAYRYLNRTVETFPYGEEFCAMMRQAGFNDVKPHRLTFGIATIYEGTKQGGEAVSDITQAVEILRNRIESSLTSASGSISGDRNRTMRLEVDIPRMSPLEWLAGQPASSKTYWRDRDSDLEIAGIGAADLIDSTRAGSLTEALSHIKSALATSGDDTRYFGGCRFNASGKVSDGWRGFGAFRFVLPRFEMVIESGRTFLACNIITGQDADKKTTILEQLKTITTENTGTAIDNAGDVSRKDTPDSGRWHDCVRTALHSIAEKKYDKIVLARETSVKFNEPVSAVKIMLRLREKSSGCYLFLTQPLADTAFFGCTPERLYQRDGRLLATEAIAGTRPRGTSEDEDTALGRELLESDKDTREHRLVVKSIEESLRPLAEENLSSVGRPEVLVKLSKVQHLKTALAASLKADTADATLLEALHPTAAVGGYPKNAVLGEIEKLEGFDRGWYAAPVGWVSRDKAEFAVAIRSALAHKESLNVYAGAGIVEGSVAGLEWEELENKISGLMKVIT